MEPRIERYELRERLGAGGMGEVWRAHDPRLARDVALKFLKWDDVDDLARFRREAQLAAQLSHPNVAAVYEFGEENGRAYIAMQLVGGVTIDRAVQGDLRRAAALVRDAARAIAYAHARGVIHRDVKPANIMVDGAHVFVMDFGLAKRVSTDGSLTRSGMLVGTPAYMSPEQARGDARSVDARSDVYGLGATLYELLAGRRAFDQASVVDLLLGVLHDDPPPLRRLNPRVNTDLETVVMKCLEKDPARRYPDATALADDLERWLNGEAVSARPPSLAWRLRRHLARRGPLAAGVLVAAVALGVLLVYVLAHRGDAALSEAKRRDDEIFGPIRERVRTLPDTPDGLRRALQLLDRGLAQYDGSWDAWMRKGDAHENLLEFDPAIAAFQRAYTINPRLGSAHYRRGLLLMETQRLDEARAELERALAVEPDLEDALICQAHLAYITGDYGRALEVCDRVEAATPHVARVHFVRGLVYVRDGPRHDAAKSEAAFSAFLKARPGHPSALNNRGLSRRERGAWDDAVADFTAAIESYPGYAASYVNRAVTRCRRAEQALRRGGDPVPLVDLALADLDRAAAVDPRNAELWNARAAALDLRGDAAGARAAADRAVELTPRDPVTLCTRAQLRADAGDAAGAAADLDEAIRLEPGRAHAWFLRAKLLLDAGRLDDALAAIDRAVDLQDDAAHRLTRARIRRARGEFQQAIADSARALELEADYVEACVERARARAAAGDRDGARADYDRALRLQPACAAALINRGTMRSADGDHDGAIADYTAAIAADAQDPIPYMNRAVARHRRASRREDLQSDAEWAAIIADFETCLRVAPSDWPHRAEVEDQLRRLKE